MWSELVEEQGFAIIPGVLSESDIVRLVQELAQAPLPKTRAGSRHALKHPSVAKLARDARLVDLAAEILGHEAIPFRATLFDKSPGANWLVVWHQDTALPVQQRFEVSNWGPWSVKDGITYARAPAAALERIVALRVHLDESTADNGPLRVLPRTHARGVLEDDVIHQLSLAIAPIDCVVPPGGVITMKPLIVHSSSKSRSDCPRRVLHIEYALSLDLENGLTLACA